MPLTRRQLLGALAACAVTGTVASCGSDGDDAADLDGKQTGAMDDYGPGTQFKATQPLTFGLLYSDHPNYPIKDDWLLWQEMTARTDVTLKPTVVPLSDYEQKRSLVIGAGDAPDIISKTYPGQEAPFVASGAILPVSKYLDLLPNYTQRVKEWSLEANIDQLRQEDGEYYVLPGLHEDPWQDYTVAVRTDVMEELGLQPPQTWDDFADMLRAVKQRYPDNYPLSDRFSETGTPAGNLMNIVSMTYGTHAGWGYDSAQWDPASNAFVFTGTSPQYKEFVTYMHSLVEEKLLDPESFTQDDDSAIQKFVSGKSFAISTNAQTLVNDYRAALADNVEGATVAKLSLPAGPAGNVIPGTTQLENGIMISSAAAEREDFGALMQFIDWLWYSPQGQEFTKWGVEGTTYTKQGEKFVLDEDIDYVGIHPDAPKHLQKDFGFSGGVFAYGGTTALLQSTFSEEEMAFQAEMLKKDVLPLDPPHPLSEVEREQATLKETPLEDFVNQSTLQFVLGRRDLGEWDAYVSEVDAKGTKDYIDLVNRAYTRFRDAHS